ncbi:hypothetical protein RUND412_004213 [Rhizina undulata]
MDSSMILSVNLAFVPGGFAAAAATEPFGEVGSSQGSQSTSSPASSGRAEMSSSKTEYSNDSHLSNHPLLPNDPLPPNDTLPPTEPLSPTEPSSEGSSGSSDYNKMADSIELPGVSQNIALEQWLLQAPLSAVGRMQFESYHRFPEENPVFESVAAGQVTATHIQRPIADVERLFSLTDSDDTGYVATMVSESPAQICQCWGGWTVCVCGSIYPPPDRLGSAGM